MNKPLVKYSSLSKLSYQEGWDLQTELHNELKNNKLSWRSLSETERLSKKQLHSLLFCEHNHVYTLGKNGSEEHLLLNQLGLEQEGVEFFKINRGGDITYHGTGQITGYPIFDMDEFYHDVHKYVRELEECIIRLLKLYDLYGERIKDFTGVWLPGNSANEPYRKICAIGVHLSRWVTMHGFALNVNTDLRYFEHIVPCGISDPNKLVTSMAKELGTKVDMEEVKVQLKAIFAEVFEFEFSE